MPVLAGQKSKFAVLKIDDESSSDDDEGFTTVSSNRRPGSGKTGGTTKKVGGLVVHALPQKPKAKGKKAKKKPNVVVDGEGITPNVVVDGEGITVQEEEGDHADYTFQQDLRLALEKSRLEQEQTSERTKEPRQSSSSKVGTKPSSTKPTQAEAKVEKKENPVEILLNQIDQEAASIVKKETSSGPVDRDLLKTALVSLYRNKLLKVLVELNESTTTSVQYQSELKKYKERYKKLCELLKDVEVKEKAQLMVELERASKIETELSSQISDLQGKLEQAKSRIHELEQRKPKD
uniref:Uncharacterized protein n=1 Tax=Plectus sambesii TaxID=2011161 RepID=A0A914V4W2_9BILA